MVTFRVNPRVEGPRTLLQVAKEAVLGGFPAWRTLLGMLGGGLPPYPGMPPTLSPRVYANLASPASLLHGASDARDDLTALEHRLTD